MIHIRNWETDPSFFFATTFCLFKKRLLFYRLKITQISSACPPTVRVAVSWWFGFISVLVVFFFWEGGVCEVYFLVGWCGFKKKTKQQNINNTTKNILGRSCFSYLDYFQLVQLFVEVRWPNWSQHSSWVIFYVTMHCVTTLLYTYKPKLVIYMHRIMYQCN